MNDRPSRISNRRSFLKTGGAVAAAITAGCSGVRDLVDPPRPAESPSGEQNWPEYRYDPGNTGYHPHATVPKDGVEVAWHHRTDTPVYSMPTVIDGVVYYGTQSGHHVAANASNGRVLWNHETAVAHIPQNGSFVERDGTVITGNADIWALDALTGAAEWSYDGSGGYVLGSPTLVDDVLYFSNWNKLLAFDPQNREPIQVFEAGGRIDVTPAVADEVAYIIDSEGVAYAVDLETFDLLWKRATGGQFHSRVPSPVVGHDLVFFTGSDESLYAVNPGDGSVEWRAEGRYDSPAIGSRYVFTSMGRLVALDPKTGERVWTYESNEFGKSIYGVTCTAESVVCFCNCEELLSVSPETGEVQWRKPIFDPRRGTTAPAIADSTLFVGGGDGVYALRSP